MSLFHPHTDDTHPLLSNEAPGCSCASPPAAAVPGCGLVSRLDPRSRTLAAGLFALLVVTLNHLPTLGLAVGLALVMAACARLPLWSTVRRMLALDGFMVLALLMLPFTVPGASLFTPLSGLSVSYAGTLQALVILAKANAVVLMVLALVGTLDPVELGHALGRLGAPDKLVHLFLFTVRYLDVLHREYVRLRIAMRARAFSMRCDRHTWQMVGYLFGMLIVRSLERAERIVTAMRCRGFDGRFPSLETPSRFARRDGVFALASCAGLVLLITFERL